LKSLELERKAGRIGKSLEAEVTIEAALLPHTALSRHLSILPELFNVSGVHVREADPNAPDWIAYLNETLPASSGSVLADLEQVRVFATPLTDAKCDRCWRHVPDVGHNANYPTVCLRCAEALDAIDFPPYPAQLKADRRKLEAESHYRNS
jgi:isoleucyl-tRNA synthetase